MDFWFPWSDCHPHIPKFHLPNTTEITKFTHNMKTEVILITLHFTYMLYKSLHAKTLLLKKINTTLIVLNKKA